MREVPSGDEVVAAIEEAEQQEPTVTPGAFQPMPMQPVPTTVGISGGVVGTTPVVIWTFSTAVGTSSYWLPVASLRAILDGVPQAIEEAEAAARKASLIAAVPPPGGPMGVVPPPGVDPGLIGARR